MSVRGEVRVGVEDDVGLRLVTTHQTSVGLLIELLDRLNDPIITTMISEIESSSGTLPCRMSPC